MKKANWKTEIEEKYRTISFVHRSDLFSMEIIIRFHYQFDPVDNIYFVDWYAENKNLW